MVILVTAKLAELIALKYLTTFIFQSALSPLTNDPIPNIHFFYHSLYVFVLNNVMLSLNNNVNILIRVRIFYRFSKV